MYRKALDLGYRFYSQSPYQSQFLIIDLYISGTFCTDICVVWEWWWLCLVLVLPSHFTAWAFTTTLNGSVIGRSRLVPLVVLV